ncbi:MAG: hypothetical protein EOP43_03520 [Sphingobacteriaceae bacterium]|nr:MAG: hypothetical protein EOP43_03520 [Sphingobacteriaceae bacterium]
MYIIPPYSYYKNYDEILLKYQGEIDDYSIYDRDDISVIMLFKEQKLAYKTTVNRSLIFDYAIKFKDNRVLSYPKSKANFIIKKEDVIVTVQNGHEYAYKKQGYSYTFKPVAVK